MIQSEPPKTKKEIEESIDFLMTLPIEERENHEKHPLKYNLGIELIVYSFNYLDKKHQEELNQIYLSCQNGISKTP